MKRKGFTLIELIAVIVILAIIALVAIPVITGIVNKSKKGAAEASALNYIDAVEKYVMLHDLDSTKYPYDLRNNTFNVSSNTEVSLLDIIIPKAKAEGTVPSLNSFITIKGEKPSDGTITIDKSGKVTEADLYIEKYNVTCTGNKCNAQKGEKVNFYATYDSNGGTGTMDQSKSTIVENSFTPPSGATFKEWNTKADGSGDTYSVGSSISENITLYAIWNYKAYSLGEILTLSDGTSWIVVEDSSSSLDYVRLMSTGFIKNNVTTSMTGTNMFLTSDANRNNVGIKFDSNNVNNYDTSSLKVFLDSTVKPCIENSLGKSIISIGIWDSKDFERLCGKTFQWNDNYNANGRTCDSTKSWYNTIFSPITSGRYYTGIWINQKYEHSSNSHAFIYSLETNSDGVTYTGVQSDTRGVKPIIKILKEYVN